MKHVFYLRSWSNTCILMRCFILATQLMETMQYQRKHVTALFLIVSFQKTCKNLGLHASSRVPNNTKPTASCFSLQLGFWTRDEALTLVFDTLHKTLCLMFDIIRNVSAPGTHISENWAGTGVPSSWAWVFLSSVPVFVRGELNNIKPLLNDQTFFI